MIINISLPEFYYNNDICNFMFELEKMRPEVFKLPVAFSSATGNFPFCYWNGGYNLNIGTSLYKEFCKASEVMAMPIRFNCSNINLTETDFDNTIANFILNSNDNGSNYIALHDLKLFKYISDKYPNYKFVFSREYELISDLPIELLNTIIDKKIFSLIELPESKNNDFDYLKQIKQKNKVELLLNATCDPICSKYKSCKLHEHDAQYNFSEDNNFMKCTNAPKYDFNKPLISIDDIKNIYLPMGINHFAIAPVITTKKNNLLKFLIDYLVKDEFKYEVLNMYSDNGGYKFD